MSISTRYEVSRYDYWSAAWIVVKMVLLVGFATKLMTVLWDDVTIPYLIGAICGCVYCYRASRRHAIETEYIRLMEEDEA